MRIRVEIARWIPVAPKRLKEIRRLIEIPPSFDKEAGVVKVQTQNPQNPEKFKVTRKLGVKSLCLNCETKTFLLGQF